MGFAGDGKTYTASELAIGLVLLMRQRGLAMGDKPVMFLDTETGSDWVKPRFDAENIELYTAKTRAFVDLLAAVNEAEQSGSVLIIDSISHCRTTAEPGRRDAADRPQSSSRRHSRC
ncbi:ATP-binding protein [Cronobacter sakazakii]|nr:ATP-binding protein [Cronobacter sakazakii]MDK1063146.1 ATP-binding protein [Cronobacter sakazakii]